VQTIIGNHCTGCHTGSGSNLPGVMDLTPITNQIGVASIQCSNKQRINPGHPELSYLVDKVLGASQSGGGCFMGQRMPFNGPPFLTSAEIATIQGWIASLPAQ